MSARTKFEVNSLGYGEKTSGEREREERDREMVGAYDEENDVGLDDVLFIGLELVKVFEFV
jgi:hypothetical protein